MTFSEDKAKRQANRVPPSSYLRPGHRGLDFVIPKSLSYFGFFHLFLPEQVIWMEEGNLLPRVSGTTREAQPHFCTRHAWSGMGWSMVASRLPRVGPSAESMSALGRQEILFESEALW